MFTGLIEEIGKIKSISKNEITVSSRSIKDKTKIGDSISVNGVCLTVTKISNDSLLFHTSPSTKELSRFNLGEMHLGEEVNLEQAMSLGDKLGGHIILGHIDDKVKIISITRKGEDTVFEFFSNEKLKPFITDKGSVAIDGISLTVSGLKSRSFDVTVIPHTLNNTNLKNKKIGDLVHIEADFFARYIFNILKNGGLKWN